MNRYLDKVASLMKNRKLLAKITSGTKQDRIKLFTKSPAEAQASNKIIDFHEDMERAVEKKQKVKGNFSFTDGSTVFVRGTPGKGMRSRVYK